MQVQAATMKVLLARCPSTVPQLQLMKRLARWAPLPDEYSPAEHAQRLYKVCRASGPYVALAALRWCANGVCTAARFRVKGEANCCLAGCDAKDDVKHYLECPALREQARRLLPGLLQLPASSSSWLTEPLLLAQEPRGHSRPCACLPGRRAAAHAQRLQNRRPQTWSSPCGAAAAGAAAADSEATPGGWPQAARPARGRDGAGC